MLKDGISCFDVSASVASKNWHPDFWLFENLGVDNVLVYQIIVSYYSQDDDVREDILELNACANLSIMEKDDVDFIINKIILDLSIKNIGSKGLKKVHLIFLLLVMLMLNMLLEIDLLLRRLLIYLRKLF